MPRLTLTFVVTAACLGHSVHARAQPHGPATALVQTMAGIETGRVTGLVRDAAGQPIPGVTIVALGDLPESARTDRHGRFAMALTVGAYVLRAAHDGYLSTYREALLVRSNTRLERNITMVRIEAAQAAFDAPGDPHAHSETAWRLRRLTRSILRDTAPSPPTADPAEPTDAVGSAAPGRSWPERGSIDRVLANTARAAASFLAGTDFTGQLHFVTATQRGDRGQPPEEWTRGIASVALGAAVGRHGNWKVRGGVAPGTAASWGLDGEYVANPARAHAFRIGVSYGVQGDAVTQAFRRSAIPEARNLGVVYGRDRWRVDERLVFDYGLRFDRADYTDQRGAISPDVAVRWNAGASTALLAAAASRALIPGSVEFIGPMADGPWLPAARTFSSLTPDAPLAISRQSRYDVGVEHHVASAQTRVSLRAFRQHTDSQSATLFCMDASRDAGHYYIATVGDVSLTGWMAGVTTAFGDRTRAGASFTSARAAWSSDDGSRIQDLAFSVASRTGSDATGVRATYRLSRGGPMSLARLAPGLVTRFDVELRQKLPYQPIHGGRLELLFSLRNLVADASGPRSAYDELLVVAPPLRIMGGVQVRF